MKHHLHHLETVELCKRIKYIHLKKGEPLFRAHEEDDRVYFLMFGGLIATFPVTEKVEMPRAESTETFMTQSQASLMQTSSQAELEKAALRSRVMSPEVKKYFDGLTGIVNRMLDTSAIDKMKQYRGQQNYLYSDYF
jgi:hypothetical protein